MPRCLAFALLACAACGADVVSAPPPSTPARVATTTDECRRGCEYQASCLPAGYRDHEASHCLADCRANLETPGRDDAGARARRWADCLTALPCGEIERSMAMDLGPAGACYARAITSRR